MSNAIKRYIVNIFAILLAVLTVFSALVISFPVSAAATERAIFEKSNVLTDLESSKDFNANDYPVKTGNKDYVEIISLVEFGLDSTKERVYEFGLYVYLYNPYQFKIKESVQNQLELSTTHDENGVASDYNKYKLVLLSQEGVFYKFRVEDNKLNIFKSIDVKERRYTVSGIELNIGEANAHDFLVGGSWTYTGFAEGYDANNPNVSTLACAQAKNAYTIEVDVHGTSYLHDSSTLGENHKNNISSVYFSIPNDILEEYGDLQKIKAKWYEYKTTPIIFTADKTGDNGEDPNYDEFKNYLGKEITEDYGPVRMLYEDSKVVGVVDTTNVYSGVLYGKKFTLINPETGHISSIEKADKPYLVINPLTWLFPVKELNGTPELNTNYKNVSIFNNESGLINGGIITADMLSNYALNFYKNYGGELDNDDYLNSRGFAKGLFQDVVDEGRTRGENVKEFDAGDKFNIYDYDDTHTDWQRFWDYFFRWGAETDNGLEGVKPIEKVKTRTSASELLINNLDYSAFEAFDENAKLKGETTHIFRFAQTDYQYNELTCLKEGWIETSRTNCAYAIETVFLDFDVMQLTFDKDGNQTTFGVVSDPIDIYTTPDLGSKGCLEFIKSYTTVILFLGVCIIGWRVINKHFVKK